VTEDHRAGDPLDTSILFDVFALNQSVGRLLARAMRDGPLTPAEYAIYSAIFELEAASPTQVAARLGIRLTTFMDQLRVIESRGHARRVGHPSDRRSYRIVLTVAGLAAHRRANRDFERADEEFGRHLPDGVAPAKRVLQNVRAAADAALDRLARPSLRASTPEASRSERR
jgi:DNA-binding MarR family transcriptional regulator